jgi:hypothetical protein
MLLFILAIVGVLTGCLGLPNTSKKQPVGNQIISANDFSPMLFGNDGSDGGPTIAMTNEKSISGTSDDNGVGVSSPQP